MLCCAVQAEEYDTSYPANNVHKYIDFDSLDGLVGIATLPT